MSLATGDVPSSSGSTGRVRAMKLKKLIETTAVVTGTTLVIAFGSVPAVAGPTHDDHSQHRNVERALATYEAMQQYLYIDDGSSLYLERYPLASDDRTYSFEWPFSQAYIATGNDAELARAITIFDLVVSGWDTDASHAAPGGVFWTQAPWSTDRNTVSTMPGAELAARLYLITGEARYLDWAKRAVAWTDQYLLAPNGLYWDNLKLDGVIDERQFSYNQGVPIGAYTLLYEATGDPQYLDKAKAIASASLAYFLADGRLDNQPIFFNSIYFKNLLLLESVTGGTTYRDAMQDYADQQCAATRDPKTGLFPVGGTATSLLDQSAMVQIYATLAWPADKASVLYLSLIHI